MHSAPQVRLTCGSDAIWRAVHRALSALAAAIAVHWLMLQAGSLAQLAPAAALVAAVLGGWLGAYRVPGDAAAVLAWDGHVWALDGRPGEVVVALDFGAWMLLRFHDRDGGRVDWVPLRPRATGVPANLCRAALHAHAGKSLVAAPTDHRRGVRG